jgi:uncharacterized pyridoxal phosphate-containing UPF0001 family protein
LDSEKLAIKLNKTVEKLTFREPLRVLIQVQTSDEGTKFGLEQDKVLDFVNFIRKECPFLSYQGLMTMGRLHDVEGFKVII